MADTLPTDEQRKQLCELMHRAFVELLYLTGEQAHDLAYAFHNLPMEIYGWGTWNVASTARIWESIMWHCLTRFTPPNHGAAANGLSAVRSMDGHYPGRRVRAISGGEAVADLIR